MNIEKDFSPDEEKNSNEIMTTSMGIIHEMLMEPMQDKITHEQKGLLALVGMTFKIMAEKATAYEKLQKEAHSVDTPVEFHNPTENDFYRN